MNGTFALNNVEAPTNLTLTSVYGYSGVRGPRIRAKWNGSRLVLAYQLRVRETNGDGSWLETFTLQSENLPKMYWVDGVRPRHAKTRHTTPPSVISSGVRYTYQVGTCDTLDCDNVTWSSRTASVRAAEDLNS